MDKAYPVTQVAGFQTLAIPRSILPVWEKNQICAPIPLGTPPCALSHLMAHSYEYSGLTSYCGDKRESKNHCSTICGGKRQKKV